jgi:hypothetical protein
MCLAKNPSIATATVADHVESHRGDLNNVLLGKLQSLCDNCHKTTKQRGCGTAVDDDGWPLR